MSLRLVRCPFCDRRYNVAGIAPGTSLRCSSCTAILTVPRPEVFAKAPARPSHGALLKASGGAAAGLVVTLVLYFALRPSPIQEISAALPPVQVAPAPPPPVPPSRPGFIDPLERIKGTVMAEFGTGIWFDAVGPYLIAIEPSDRTGRGVFEEYGRRLETLHDAFRREIGDPLKLPVIDETLLVVVLSSRERFDDYFRRHDGLTLAPEIKGIYDQSRRRVVLYNHADASCQVVFHEGVHQLVHAHTLRRTGGLRLPPKTYWFEEGLGTYFEGFRRAGERIEIDPDAGRQRLPVVKQALRSPDRKDFIPLSVLVGMTVDDFWTWFQKGREGDAEATTRRAQLYYAQSWAFVYFLRQRGGAYKSTFDDYFLAEISGRGGKEEFERLLRANLGLELSQLEGEFVEFISGLP